MEEDTSFEERLAPHLPKFLAALAATGAGLGTYAYLRHRRLSDDPALRALQEASKGKLTHILPGSRKDTNLLTRAFNRLTHAGGGAVAYADDLNITDTIPGAVFHGADSYGLGEANILEGSALVRLAKRFGFADKGVEAKIFEKYAPGSMPDTTRMSSFLSARFGDRLKKYEDILRKKYPGGYILKTTAGAATGGGFPTEAKSLKDYLAGGGHASEVVDQLLKDPAKVIAQERVPIAGGNVLDRLWGALRGTPATKELRVHVFNGAVAPSLTRARFSPSAAISGSAQKRQAENFVKDILARFPKDLKDGTYAFDVAPVVGGGFKVIESNPAHTSGFLSLSKNPLYGYQLHRDVTGHTSELGSALAGALAATSTGVAAKEIAEAVDKARED